MLPTTAISEVWNRFELRVKKYLDDRRYSQHPGFFQAAEEFLETFRRHCATVYGTELLDVEQIAILVEGNARLDAFANEYFGEVPY